MKDLIFAFLVAMAPVGIQSAAAQSPAPVVVPSQSAPVPVGQSMPVGQAIPVTPSTAVPPTLSLPVGTIITVETTEKLSSDHDQTGDGFVAVLHQPLVANGWVIARRGQTVIGRVASARRAGRVKGTSELGLELTELALVDGQQMPVRTQLMQTAAPGSRSRDAGAIVTTTGAGTAAGAAAGGGEGAAIGAAIGAAAGVAGVLMTRGRATEIPAESVLTFRLDAPLEVSTQRSQQAFLPVTPTDYNTTNATLHAPPPVLVQPHPLYAGYYWPDPFWYGPYFGFGPRVYFGGPRLMVGRRWR